MLRNSIVTFIAVVVMTTAYPQPIHAFFMPSNGRSHSNNQKRTQYPTKLAMGFFDNVKLIMSEEGKKNIAAYNARERAEQEAAQREILKRRRNPKLMKQYEQEKAQSRKQLQQERDTWQFQSKIEKGYDPLQEWKVLRSQGKIQVGSDMKRDEQSRRLGSEGLVEVRTDERLPYIDQGYVDEDADFMGNMMKLLGGGDKTRKK